MAVPNSATGLSYVRGHDRTPFSNSATFMEGLTPTGKLPKQTPTVPAVVSGHTDRLWVFLLAPMVGAEVAARLLKTLQRRRQVLTHRLCGTEVSGEPLGERRTASARI